MNDRAVRVERTNWRDARMSQKHREWGWDCPAIDLDFLMVEYDRGKAVAIVEYKHEWAARQFPHHPSYRALIDLGNRAGLPVLAVRYADDFSWWAVTPLNDAARQVISGREMLSEVEYVEFLYRLRGHVVPQRVLRQLMPM